MSDIDSNSETNSVDTTAGSVDASIPDDIDTPEIDEPESTDSAVEEKAKSIPRGLPLRVQNLSKTFGGITAVNDATFSVEEGSLTGLIGPNGAGKSTTFNCIAGALDPTGGTIHFKNEEITGLQPHEVANRGLVRTFQMSRELKEMTVLENMMLSPGGQAGERLIQSVVPGLRGSVIRQEQAIRERAWETLEFFEIDHLAGEYAGNLSGGQRKLLEMARALMTDPEMVLLDEPLAGVNPSLEQKILERIHDLREEGYTFLLVEHDMDIVMNNCDPIIVMHQGTVLAEDHAEEIKQDERVINAYLGEDL